MTIVAGGRDVKDVILVDPSTGQPYVAGGSGGGGGSNASVSSTGAASPSSATAVGFQNASGNLVIPTPADGLPVSTPVGAPHTGAKAIATTASAIALGSGALQNGVVIKASSTNAAAIVVGPADVTNTTTSAANGYPLAPGEAISVAAANLSQVYINGTAGDFVFFVGN